MREFHLEVSEVSVDAADPQLIFVADPTGLSRSTDGGRTWEQVIAGTVTSVAASRSTPDTIYASTPVGGLRLPGCGIVCKSVDEGTTWTEADTGIERAQYGVRDFVIDPTTSDHVYAVTSEPISPYEEAWETTTGGGSWTKLDLGDFVEPQALSYAPSVSTVYAATFSDGLLRSTDGGDTWDRSNDGLVAMRILAVAVAPTAPSTSFASVAGQERPGGTPVYATSDGGASWETTASIPKTVYGLMVNPTNPSEVYAGTAHNIYRSKDAGTTWRRLHIGRIGPVFALASVPGLPHTLLAGGPYGIFESADDGLSWSELTGSPSGVRALAVDPADPATLYAGTTFNIDSGAVYRSVDGGVNWTQLATGSSAPCASVALDPSAPGTVYAAAFSEGVLRSIDGGDTWSFVNAGLTALGVQAVAIDAAHPGAVYAGTSDGGVFRSSDGGDSWKAWNDGLSDRVVGGLSIDPAGSLVNAGTAAGVFVRSP